jgi:hypothetical protein
MSENNSAWSIVDLGEAPPIPAAPATPVKGRAERVRDAIYEVLCEVNESVDRDDILFDEEGDTLVVRVDGFRTTDGGDIEAVEREYLWTGVITVSVSVSGTVTAANDDEAQLLAEDAVSLAYIDSIDVDGYSGDVYYEGHDIEDYNVHDVDKQ